MTSREGLAGYYTEAEVSRLTGKAISTLRSDAARRKGPPRTVINRKVYYRVCAFKKWLVAQEQNFGTADPDGANAHESHRAVYENVPQGKPGVEEEK